MNAPLTWPKSVDSSRSGGRAPELTSTKGRPARGSWRRCQNKASFRFEVRWPPRIDEPLATFGGEIRRSGGVAALCLRCCFRHQRYEAGHRRAQDIEKLTEAPAAVGGLLLEFCHDDPLFLAKHGNEERLRV